MITRGPQTKILVPHKDVIFSCLASSDPLTPVSYRWLFNGMTIFNQPGRTEHDGYGTLRIITRNDCDGGRSFAGNFTCIATNGYSHDSASALLIDAAADNETCIDNEIYTDKGTSTGVNAIAALLWALALLSGH